MKIDRRRIVWAAIALFMFAGPVAFDLARASGFTASTPIYPRRIGPYPPVTDPNYYRRLLGDSDLQRYMRTTAGARSSVYLDAQFPFQPPDTVLVTVRAGTPARARAFADALAHQIAEVTARELASEAGMEAKMIRVRLAAPGLGRAKRRSLGRRLGAVQGVLAAPAERVAESNAPTPQPPLTHPVDKFVNALPGSFPPRPSPLWAGLAGLLLVALARAIGVAVFSPRRIRSGKLPPP
jgi:hypothetical protein